MLFGNVDLSIGVYAKKVVKRVNLPPRTRRILPIPTASPLLFTSVSRKSY